MTRFGMACLAAAFLAPAAARGHAFVATESRIMTDLEDQDRSDQFDPAISGNLVVYTDARGRDLDVYAYDLAAGEEFPVTTASGNQQLTDVWNGFIVYSDLGLRHVMLFDTATGATTDLNEGATTVSLDPSIGDGLVAWTDNRDGNWEIYARDLATGDERRISDALDRDEASSTKGGVIVWQRCAAGQCNVLAYDWATGSTTVLPNPSAADRRFPDTDGARVVYQALDPSPSKDVCLYDLAAGQECCLALPGDQVNPRLSGDWVSFEDLYTGGVYSIRLWHVPSGLVFDVSRSAAPPQYLHAIEGNRVVWTDDRNGQLDVYILEFWLRETLVVSPTAYSFGGVNVGMRKSTIVTISNTEGSPMIPNTQAIAITSLGFDAASAAAFSIRSPPALPVQLAAGETLDVEVEFAPAAAGPASGVLLVGSDDGLQPLTRVALSGEGVAIEAPAQELADLLTFFDESVASGALFGSGAGASANGRLGALRNMLKATGDLIDGGEIGLACAQLLDAYRRVDGASPPPDFGAGPAAAVVRDDIAMLRKTLLCP